MEYVVIYLGSRCNASCPYCHANKETDSITSPSLRLLTWLKDNDSPQLSIKYLGGEPLLYLDCIDKIYEAAPQAQHTIMTNGLLLTDSLVDYFNRRKFTIVVSFDGIRGIRGYDDIFYSEEKAATFARLNKIGIGITIGQDNADIPKIIENVAEIESRIKRMLPIYMHTMHPTTPDLLGHEMTGEQYRAWTDWNKKVIDRFMADYRAGALNIRLWPQFRQLAWISDERREPMQNWETACSAKHSWMVDLDGNNYICGYTRGKTPSCEMIGESKNTFKRSRLIKSKQPKCARCPLRFRCGSICIESFSITKECEFQIAMYNKFEEVKKHYKTNICDVLRWAGNQEASGRTGGFREIYEGGSL